MDFSELYSCKNNFTVATGNFLQPETKMFEFCAFWYGSNHCLLLWTHENQLRS